VPVLLLVRGVNVQSLTDRESTIWFVGPQLNTDVAFYPVCSSKATNHDLHEVSEILQSP